MGKRRQPKAMDGITFVWNDGSRSALIEGRQDSPMANAMLKAIMQSGKQDEHRPRLERIAPHRLRKV